MTSHGRLASGGARLLFVGMVLAGGLWLGACAIAPGRQASAILRSRSSGIRIHAREEWLALDWLEKQAAPDGLWKAPAEEYSPALSALALWAFITAGDPSGTHEAFVSRKAALLDERLLEKKDGRVFADPRAVAYTQTLSALVFSELHAITGAERWKVSAERILESLGTFVRQPGDWPYPLDPHESGPVGYFVPAVLAAQGMALEGGDAMERDLHRYILHLYDPEHERIIFKGPTKWCGMGHGSNAMALFAVRAFRWGDLEKAGEVIRRGLLAQEISWKPVTRPEEADNHAPFNDFYAWHFMALALADGSPEGMSWTGKLQDMVASKQVREGPDKGSWDPCDIWMMMGNRVYSTATLCCILATDRAYRLE